MHHVQATWFNTKSVQYDAVVIVGGEKSVNHLEDSGKVVTFINEAFKHGKPIIALAEGVKFIRDFEWDDITVVKHDQDFESSQGVVTAHHYNDDLKDDVFKAVLHHRFPYRDIKRVPA